MVIVVVVPGVSVIVVTGMAVTVAVAVAVTMAIGMFCVTVTVAVGVPVYTVTVTVGLYGIEIEPPVVEVTVVYGAGSEVNKVVVVPSNAVVVDELIVAPAVPDVVTGLV